MLSASKATADVAFQRYTAAHDAVVASKQYKQAYEAGENVIKQLTSTSLYKTAEEKVYKPYVSCMSFHGICHTSLDVTSHLQNSEFRVCSL